MALITLFNFWFTINRLSSAARIVAYIQVVLEDKSCGTWLGWETSLRMYRKWQNEKRKNNELEALIDDEIDGEALPDTLLYYKPIYYFHVCMVFSGVIAAYVVVMLFASKMHISLCALTVIVALVSIWYFISNRPTKVRRLIERNKVIWENSLK